jgi:hypothetical protein
VGRGLRPCGASPGFIEKAKGEMGTKRRGQNSPVFSWPWRSPSQQQQRKVVAPCTLQQCAVTMAGYCVDLYLPLY